MTKLFRGLAAVALALVALPADAAGPTNFYSVTPCRILDSRLAEGALQGPYQPATQIDIDVTGALEGQGGAESCGIPFPAAKMVALNVTAVAAAGAGRLELGPFGTVLDSDLGVVHFGAGQTRANNAVAALCDADVIASCEFDVSLLLAASAADVVIDVAGYFAAAPAQCGNAVCEAGEDKDIFGLCGSCPQDCGGSCCGDGVCDAGEDCETDC